MPSRWTIAACGIASALALQCGSSGMAKATGPLAPGATRLTFAWGLPCRVPVIETATTDEATIRAHYTLDLRPSAVRPGEAELRKLDLELDAIGGAAATEAERVEFRGAAALAPVLRIGPSGSYLGFVDPAQAVEHALILMVRTGGLPAEEVPAARARMLSAPELIDAAAAEAGEDWELIVGGWLGVTDRVGETRRTEVVLDAGPLQARRMITVVHRGVWPGTSLVVVERQSDLPPDGMRAIALADAAERASGVSEAERAALFDRAQRTSGRSTTVTRIATEARSLRSLRLEHAQTTEIVVAGEPPTTSRTSRQLAFDWDHAAGCRPAW